GASVTSSRDGSATISSRRLADGSTTISSRRLADGVSLDASSRTRSLLARPTTTEGLLRGAGGSLLCERLGFLCDRPFLIVPRDRGWRTVRAGMQASCARTSSARSGARPEHWTPELRQRQRIDMTDRSYSGTP